MQMQKGSFDRLLSVMPHVTSSLGLDPGGRRLVGLHVRVRPGGAGAAPLQIRSGI